MVFAVILVLLLIRSVVSVSMSSSSSATLLVVWNSGLWSVASSALLILLQLRSASPATTVVAASKAGIWIRSIVVALCHIPPPTPLLLISSSSYCASRRPPPPRGTRNRRVLADDPRLPEVPTGNALSALSNSVLLPPVVVVVDDVAQHNRCSSPGPPCLACNPIKASSGATINFFLDAVVVVVLVGQQQWCRLLLSGPSAQQSVWSPIPRTAPDGSAAAACWLNDGCVGATHSPWTNATFSAAVGLAFVTSPERKEIRKLYKKWFLEGIYRRNNHWSG